MTRQNLAEEIKKRRKIIKISQEQLADMAEVGLRTLKSIEMGHGNPTLTTIGKLAKVLGMELKLDLKKTEL